MIPLAGWVPVRRGLLDHLRQGRLSANELAAFMVLLLLADASTGKGTINGPTLHYFMPDVSHQGCTRVLKSLAVKGYISRTITPRSKAVYPYAIARYEITRGALKGMLTESSQPEQGSGFRNGDASSLDVQTHVQGDDHMTKRPSTGDVQTEYSVTTITTRDKGEETHKKRQETPLVLPYVEVSENVSDGVMQLPSAKRTNGDGRGESLVTGGEPRDAGLGLRWSASEGLYRDVATGREISHDDANARLAPYGVRCVGRTFFESRTGIEITFEELKRRVQ